MAKQATSLSKGESVVTEAADNPIYRTVQRELRTLKEAAENVGNSRWSAIKDRAAGTATFVSSRHK